MSFICFTFLILFCIKLKLDITQKFIFLENDKIGIEKNFAKWFEDLNLTPALEETMEDVEIPKTSSADIFAFS